MRLRLASFWDRGGGWVLGQIGLMIAVGVAGWSVHAELPWSGLSILGGSLIAWGALTGISGVVALGKNRTIFPAPNTGASLISHGIYRWVRHPLYSSLIALAFGWSCLRWSWAAAVASLVLSGFLWFKAKREEAWLSERFSGYHEYQTRTKRFFPGLL